eukprot:TRINITY_DN12642_c0_g1_i1.p1 TRINITY_DN12642_c0_g1~~TRINITY_DN12642_c0_g1_i1.p1  ORF type:complete len:989 (-),score=241.99 TRINITY_DN12642_c0_g1_i1:45-3011(-)
MQSLLSEDLESGEHLHFQISADKLSNIIKENDQAEIQARGGVEGIAKLLYTDLRTGLTQSEQDQGFPRRKENFGTNVLLTPPAKSLLRLMWEALGDRTLQILIVAAVVSIVLGLSIPEERKTGWIEGTAILLAVVIIVTVVSMNDYNKEKQFRKLSAVKDAQSIKVKRAGNDTLVSIFDLQVGDLVILENGDSIPADGMFVSGFDLSVDESSMTGESELVQKDQRNNLLLSNTKVMEGSGLMLVLAVGMKTQWGIYKALLDRESENTPLQEKLETLAENIGKAGLGAAILTFIALVIVWVIRIVQGQIVWSWGELSSIVDFVIISITIVVVAVPEGLPLAVTISLAYSMMKMMKDQNLVRHLAACETMGGATNICSDKTGTLTQNKMTVLQGWIAGKRFDVSNLPSFSRDVAHLFAEGLACNSTAYLTVDSTGRTEYVGSKTECALLEFCKDKLGIDWLLLRKSFPVERRYPFNSTNKEMSTLIRVDPAKCRLHKKGAPELVIPTCSHVLNAAGQPIAMTESILNELKKVVEDMASDGLRTLILVCADKYPPIDLDAPPTDRFIVVGIVGIKDPLRAEVPDAVDQCKRAGVFVRMVTGDNILTARHIATECGILDDHGIAIEGPKFRNMPTQKVIEMLPRLQVIARASPEDKMKLVQILQDQGEVVASTGDGTNDAPQLKQADVGFAMGKAGTEVAKEASDIILLDDNFASIVKAIMWGRNVYDSIRKFLQFQLTVNIVAVAIAFIGAVSTGESPLSAVQMLWVNMIMDTMAALALATEQPTPALLERPPYGRFDNLISNRMWRQIIGQAVFQLILFCTILYAYDSLWFIFPRTLDLNSNDVKHTIIFNTFVFAQLFNEINSRKLGDELNVFSGFFTNYIFVVVLVLSVVVQFLMVQFAGAWAQTTALNAQEWFVCVGLGFISLPIGILLRFIPVPADKTRVIPDREDELLLPDTRTLSVFESKWKIARKVLAQIRVINAFRRPSGHR